ncbi:MAG TPA: class I SAM-dependent methyltransferase, partial [Gammaproteobacteria bacterium]|nr:class I SAM-dependent methyltransferase [Gammaproteobacteria bacterium]
MRVRQPELIKLSTPIWKAGIQKNKSALSSFIDELTLALKSGLFICPDFQLKHTTLTSPIRGELLEIISPDATKLSCYKKEFNLTLWPTSIKYYKVSPNETTHIILRRNIDGYIDAISMDLRADLFRWLMLLTPRSIDLLPLLENSDYWIVDRSFTYSKMTEKTKNLPRTKSTLDDRRNVMSTINIWLNKTKHTPITSFLKDKFESIIFHDLQVDMTGKMQEPEKTAEQMLSGDIEKIAAYAYKQAKLKHGYSADLATFSAPNLKVNKDYVSQQITKQLADAGILVTGDEKPRMVLFVGEGDAQNAAAICKVYSKLECFILEPLSDCIEKAKTRIEENRILQMTLEEMPAELNRIFNFVFVFNYNIRDRQVTFFKDLFRITKQGGQVIVGRAVTDPEFIRSNKGIGAHLNEVFGNNRLGNTVQIKDKIHPDYQYKQVLYIGRKETSQLMAKTNIENEEDQTLIELINQYNQNELNRLNGELSVENRKVQQMNAATLTHLLEVSKQLNASTPRHVDHDNAFVISGSEALVSMSLFRPE